MQRSNPQKVDLENAQILQIANMYLQSGKDLPMEMLVNWLNWTGKDRIIRFCKEIDARNDTVKLLMGQLQQATAQIEQMKGQLDAYDQQAQKQAELLQAATAEEQPAQSPAKSPDLSGLAATNPNQVK